MSTTQATTVLVTAILLAAGAAMAAASGATQPAPSASVFRHFITRSGGKLMDGEREFRFLGANMPGLILPYDFTLKLPERLVLPTAWEQEDGFKTLDQMNLRVVRFWVLPIRSPSQKAENGGMTWHYVQGPEQFNDESFKCIDSALALANKYGVRVIFSFSAAQDQYHGGYGTIAAHRGKKREQFWTDPQLRDDYKAVIRYVLNRKNTVTGQAYKEDKAILAWQFGNEMMSATEAWLSEMAAYIKTLDTNHLVIDTRHRSVPDPGRVDPHIDIYVRHYYPENGDWVAQLRKEVAALKGQRPLVVGEFGPYPAEKRFANYRPVPELKRFLDHLQGEPGISGAAIWSMYFHHRDGGFYWHQIFTYPSVWSYHWPGFVGGEAQQEREILWTLREAAFRIQGLKAPPVPRPDAPQLLPIGEAPLISWRGSAGATGYDVERAANPAGPWTKIARDVSDADVAYRPLYTDITAKGGDTWHYRVIARNASGESEPSNVVGPVKVKAACLVDELQGFSLTADRSEKLTLDNTYNALYAEYLFRAKGDKGEWLAYQTPGDISSFKVTTWFAGQPSDFGFEASPDGKAYQTVKVERRQRDFGSPPGGVAAGQKRTMVEYRGAAPPGNRYLRITWTGPAEIDRVEVYHSGQ